MRVVKVDRQDRDIGHVYNIRRRVFEQELGYARTDRHVYNEWDALSNHHLLVDNEPVGTVSVVDWTGLTDILEAHGLDPSRSTVKVTKLALLPSARSLKNILRLIEAAKEDLQGYDFVTCHVTPPSTRPDDELFLKRGRQYQRLFGLRELGRAVTDVGMPMYIFGRTIDF